MPSARRSPDPGGWEALGLVTARAVPLAALAGVAWYRPDWATRLFAVLIAAVIGASVWFAVDPQGWLAFEDRHGPIRAILTFVLAAAVAVLGVQRTAVAGLHLLVLGVVPVVVSSLGSQLGLASLAVVTPPPLIAGVCTCGQRPWRVVRRRQKAYTPDPRIDRRRHDHGFAAVLKPIGTP